LEFDVKHVFTIRRSRRLLSVVACLVLITVELAGADDRASTLPVVAEHRYRMLARVRPLLVWISREDVGDARITRRNDGAGSMGFELLIGSDPARAPRRINRWGYLAEQVAGGQATVLGVMKQSNEQSIEEAEGRLTAESGSGAHLFKAIRSTTADGRTSAAITILRVQNDLTYRDVESLLAMVPGSGNSPMRTLTLPGRHATRIPCGGRRSDSSEHREQDGSDDRSRFTRNQVCLQRALPHAQTSLARVAGDFANRRTNLQ
jgi:hypothetical protein